MATKLVGTTYKGKPAVDVVICGYLVKTYVNETSMSMLSFMKWVADERCLEIAGFKGQAAICY